MTRPAPLRTDGSNAFARYSMQTRVPAIAREVVSRNPDYAPSIKDAIERLARDIEEDAPLPVPLPPAPYLPAWRAIHAAHAGQSWLHAEWFYAELAFYFELTRACRFWETGRDPFAPVKEEELAGDKPWARLEAALSVAGSREERVASLLDASLWGNRVDLSYTVAASREHRHDDDLLVDDRPAAVPFLVRPGAHVHLVADNTGTELALDLAVIDAILAGSSRVTVHLKMQPVFVSDAMPADLWRVADRMREVGGLARGVSERLRAAFEDGRLSLLPDPFWSGPSFLWEAPSHVKDALASATMVVLKGDANYRRLVGDAPWPPATPFAEAASYVGAPVLCIRTMKSDSVLGLPAGLAGKLDAEDARWRIDGRRGLIQIADPRGQSSEPV